MKESIEYKEYKEYRYVFESRYEDKKYYTTKEIMERLGVSIRHIRSRIAELRTIHEGNKRMMYQDKRKRWFISTHLMDKFQPKKRHKKATRYSQKWKSFITWIMRDNYCEGYHNFLCDELTKLFPKRQKEEWLFVVEKTKRGVNHVHALGMEPYENIFKPLNELIYEHKQDNDYNLLVGEVLSPHKSERYLRK